MTLAEINNRGGTSMDRGVEIQALAASIEKGIREGLGEDHPRLRLTGLGISDGSPWRVFKPRVPPGPDSPPEERQRWTSVAFDVKARVDLGLPGIANRPAEVQKFINGIVGRVLRESCPDPEDAARRTTMVLRTLAQFSSAMGGGPVHLSVQDICQITAGMALGEFIAPLGDAWASRWEAWAKKILGFEENSKEPWAAVIATFACAAPVGSGGPTAPESFSVVVPFGPSGASPDTLVPQILSSALGR